MDMYHKTVLLLDHSSAMRESSGGMIELDAGPGAGGNGSSRRGHSMQYFPFVPPIAKTLWTCAIEGTLEYSRIVWDIFTEERLLQFLFADPSQTRKINTWEQDKQNMNYICEAFIDEGAATKSRQGGCIQLGIKSALQALSTPSQAQEEQMHASKSALNVVNRGRVICLTSCTTDNDLLTYFHTTLSQHNESVSPSDQFLPIHQCEFVLVSIHPIGKERHSRVTPLLRREISPILTAETCIVSADKVYDKMIELCTSHHDLVVTTVTGIPMKEEQNSTSSSNYDVPLFHPRMPTTSVETQTLKWSNPSTPKTATGILHPCNSACRITPVDVNSRPSTCLSNFVLSGRLVWLETPRKGKLTSHVLMKHGGEIWMHIMETARNILEDPPSISEGIGGRVTDYRIPDFVELMRLNMLAPYIHPSRQKQNPRGNTIALFDKKVPVDIAKARLTRKTVFWPLTISGSLLFPMAVHLEDLLRLMPKDKLSDIEKVTCDKTIWQLMSIEARGDAPPLPAPHHKKQSKRDQQWRLVYNEVENFIRANLHSDMHIKVLECFLECRRTDSKSYSKDKDKEGGDVTKILKPPIADSPASPTPGVAPMDITPDLESSAQPKLNLLALWRLKTEKKDLRALPPTFKLYAHLDGQDNSTKNSK